MCTKDLNTDHAHVQISGLYYERSRSYTLFSIIEGKLQKDEINSIQTYNYPNLQVRKSKNKSFLTFFLS